MAAGQRIVGPYLPIAGFNALGPEAGVRRRSTVAMVMPLGEVAPGASKSHEATLFAGPQEEHKLAALAPGTLVQASSRSNRGRSARARQNDWNMGRARRSIRVTRAGSLAQRPAPMLAPPVAAHRRPAWNTSAAARDAYTAL